MEARERRSVRCSTVASRTWVKFFCGFNLGRQETMCSGIVIAGASHSEATRMRCPTLKKISSEKSWLTARVINRRGSGMIIA